MKNGWLFFIKALAIFWRNRTFALTVCLPIYLVVLVLDIWIRLDVLGELSLATIPWPINDPYVDEPEASMTLGQAISQTVVWLVAVVMMAILWHRYVLTSKGIAPATSLGWLQPIVYILKLTGIWLLPAIPFGIVLFFGVKYFTVVDVGGSGSDEVMATSFGHSIFWFAFAVAYGWAIMRLSLALPETALGRPGSIFDSWTETGPFALPLLITASLEVLVFMLPGAVASGLALWSESIAYLIQAVFYWGALMVGISILTLLYEHVHFGRSLNTQIP